MIPASDAIKPDLNGEFASHVVVAIVNYCTPELVIDCLESLVTVRKECAKVTVVVADNDSPDGSGKVIEDAISERGWGEWAQLMHMPRNGGFSYGNNGVIRRYLHTEDPPEFFWLLNSDTIAREGSLAELLAFMRDNPTAGLAGSRLEYHDGTAQHSAFRFHSIPAEFEGSANVGLVSRWLRGSQVSPDISDVVEPCDWLSGASMLIRREVLEDIGLFDEGYFLYYEETDFCLRAKAKGWHCWYVPQSHVVHLVGKSTGVTERREKPLRRAPFWFESRRRYFVKHHGRLYAIVADIALFAGTLVWRARAAIERRPSMSPEKFLRDLISHSAVINSTNVQTQE